jgi:hypothetical protein
MYVNQFIYYPGSLQWDGKYLAIGNYLISTVYRFVISGQSAKVVDSLKLSDGGRHSIVAGFWIKSPSIVGVDVGRNRVGIWKYPAGGPALKAIFVKPPSGLTISDAK